MWLHRELWARLIIGGCLLAGTGACGRGDDAKVEDDTGTGTEGDTDAEPVETTTVEVTVTFKNEMMKTVTNSVHVWVLRPKGDLVPTCGDLVGKLLDPYDLTLLRLAEQVSTSPTQPSTIEAVELGDAFIYVEGVTIAGKAEFAGCVSATLVQPSTSVEIVLGPAGAFDCSDPATENGAPCDDGAFCTTGKTCSNGTCQGGLARDCSILADQCNAASCSETDGCVVSPVPNDTPCNDALTCTQNDSCQDGACVGVPLECDADAGPCRMSLGCSEPTGECSYVNINAGLACDDGLYCTVDTVCVAGTCVGSPMECAGDDCNVGECNEQDRACITTFADTTTPCSDADNVCTAQVGLCDGAGACSADPANEGGDCDNRGELGVCEAGACVEPPEEG